MPPFSYILFVIFLCYLGGIISANFIPFSFNLIFLLGVVNLILAVIFHTRRIFYLFLCGMFYIIGITAGIKELGNARVLEGLRKGEMREITVKVKSIPTRVEDKIVFTGYMVDKNTNVKIYASSNDEVKPGQVVKLKGRFRKRKDGVDFYGIESRIIRDEFSLKRFIYDLKIYLSSVIDRLYPRGFSDFMKAITIGEEENLKVMRSRIRKAGLAHTLAISGLHVGLILFFFYFIFKNIGIRRKARSILLIFISVIYLFLTSGRPPVMRATIMAVVYLYFSLFYIRVNVFNLILFAGLLILLLQPLAVYQVSFQLSFIAVVGICLTLKLFPYPQGYSIKSKIVNYFKVIFSAWLFTFPLIWFYWRRFAVFQLPVNFFLVPIFTLILGMGFCSLVFSLFSLPLAKFFAVSCYPFLYLFLKTSEWVSRSSYSWIKLPSVGWKTIIVIYIFLSGGLYMLSVIIRKKTGGVRCFE